MSQKVLQVNFNFSISAEDLARAFTSVAPTVAETPGLRWKLFLINTAASECAGHVLFDDEASAQGYLAGPIIGGVKTNPVFTNLSIKLFDVMEAPSLITRAPIEESVAA